MHYSTQKFPPPMLLVLDLLTETFIRHWLSWCSKSVFPVSQKSSPIFPDFSDFCHQNIKKKGSNTLSSGVIIAIVRMAS